jgi:branched-subunit amino acid transport protein
MMIATQISRLAPMFISSKFQMSEGFERWLKFIPVSVLAALIVPEFFEKTDLGIRINDVYIISGLIAFGVGIWRKNLLTTTVAGVLSLALLRLILQIF